MRSMIKTYAPGLIISALMFIVWFIINMNMHPYIVSGTSMQPTYNPDDSLKCEEYESGTAANGEIYIFKHNNLMYIKRLVGMPGDTLQIIGGKLYVNGIENPYIEYELIKDQGILCFPYTLNKDEYFFMGDNANSSIDSRDFGAISEEQIKYKVISKIIE